MAKINLRRAGGEFLIIFAGVTLGLLADDYRERRRDAAEARGVLTLVREDLLQDSTSIATVMGPLEGHRKQAIQLQSIWSAQSVPADSLGWIFRAFIFNNSLQLRASGFSSLKDGGTLRLIRNPDLRVALVRYYERTQVRLEKYHDDHDESRYALWESLYPHILLPPGREPGSLFPIVRRPVALTSSWSEVQQDNFVINRATQVGMLASLFGGLLQGALAENLALRQEIDAELGR
ncbi:hypothetical protein ACFL5A_02910 [Gemmatimonadota bacterium]